MSYLRAYKRWNFIRTNLIEFSNLTAETILDHKIGAIFFKKYVKDEKTNLYSKIMNNWRGYIFCKQLMNNLHLINDKKVKEEVYLWRPTYLMRNKIVQIIENFEKNKNEEETKESLKNLSKQYMKEMKIEEFYNDLMFELVFERDRIERQLGKIYEDIIEQNNLKQSMVDLMRFHPNN